MGAAQNPRQAVAELLRGKAPARPLFLPIVFSLGAQIENVPLRSYLANPTKIVSALRQIHARMGADGVSCYFDPFLEAEALGGTLEWETEDGPPRLVWPGGVAESGLPRGIRSAEDAAKSGRVPVAAEVICRMKEAVRGSALLMVGLNGPMALAGMLLGVNNAPEEEGRGKQRPYEEIAKAVEVAGAALTEIARTLLEAGANVIVMRGTKAEASPVGEPAEGEQLLETILNLVRFYEGMLLFFPSRDSASRPAKRETPSAVVPNGLVPCTELPRLYYTTGGIGFGENEIRWGLAFPPEFFAEEESEYAKIEQGLHLAAGMARHPKAGPTVVTTSGDVPAASDMKRLARIGKTLVDAGRQ